MQVFGPAFRRNSRWSVQTPVPEVGDEGTPYADVDKFYDFWFGFKSWREFPHPDEEDLEQAECREEKRCALPPSVVTVQHVPYTCLTLDCTLLRMPACE